jgi:HAD superfamily hydrolase (TIGR01484 family)
MKNLNEFNSKIEFVLTDIDDTITTEGQLGAKAYASLWKLHHSGIKIIPITGRPAGWCEMIARFWPVEAVVGENGGFYFRYALEQAINGTVNPKNKKMQRWFFSNEQTISENKFKLAQIEKEILASVSGCAISSDQFCRLMDLAIDFCEDVTPLGNKEIEQIYAIFDKHGAQAKVSSIHVNGWFGSYNKLSTTLELLKNTFNLTENECLTKCAFVGDSPNDEPMFKHFPLSFGVANINKFSHLMTALPQYIAPSSGGEGFTEIAEQILLVKN